LIPIVGEYQFLSPEARLARQLLRLSATDPIVEVRQNDLAGILGMSKTSFRRALKALVNSGAIETG
jgi:DNA-binding GntR family transcriptional regulator